jgi:hypothetical protein
MDTHLSKLNEVAENNAEAAADEAAFNMMN